MKWKKKSQRIGVLKKSFKVYESGLSWSDNWSLSTVWSCSAVVVVEAVLKEVDSGSWTVNNKCLIKGVEMSGEV